MSTLQHILMPQPAARNLAVALAGQVIPPILFCSIWYRYLLKSRRVERTFAGDQPERQQARLAIQGKARPIIRREPQHNL